jgi:tRNA threonylcarbamoyladenosine biosynthesis protein TsaB
MSKPVLAIETSGSLCGVSVYFDDGNHFEEMLSGRQSHSKKIFESIDSALHKSGVELKDLEWIAVSSGPGSFTGLRIGLSAAKGLALGAALPIVLVPTFEAIALQLLNKTAKGDSFVVANKVNSEEIYYASFINNGNSFNFVEDLQIIRRDELNSKSAGRKIYSNAEEFNSSDFVELMPEPFYVAKWSRIFGKELANKNFDYLEPNYLKNFVIPRR